MGYHSSLQMSSLPFTQSEQRSQGDRIKINVPEQATAILETTELSCLSRAKSASWRLNPGSSSHRLLLTSLAQAAPNCWPCSSPGRRTFASRIFHLTLFAHLLQLFLREDPAVFLLQHHLYSSLLFSPFKVLFIIIRQSFYCCFLYNVWATSNLPSVFVIVKGYLVLIMSNKWISFKHPVFMYSLLFFCNRRVVWLWQQCYGSSNLKCSLSGCRLESMLAEGRHFCFMHYFISYNVLNKIWQIKWK